MNGGYVWLRVPCNACQQTGWVDLTKIQRRPDTPIWKLEASLVCHVGDELEVDLVGGSIRNLTQDRIIAAAALDPRAVDLLAAGGLIPYLKTKYAA